MTISPEQRRLIRERAVNCCEYCRIPESGGTITFHVDHIIPLKHNGTDETDNLCLACYKCNGYKGSNVAALDPESGEATRLYHPREQAWDEHFWLEEDSTIRGLSPEGRTTIPVLQINEQSRVQHRQLLMELGVYPCK